MGTRVPKADPGRAAAAKSFVVTPDAPAVGLLAMRVASIIRRSQQQSSFRLAAPDRADVRRAREALLSGVAATERTAMPRPGRHARQLTSMGLIFGAVTKDQRVDATSLVESLTSYADDLQALLERQQLRAPDDLLRYYERLTTEARRMTSSGGERVVRRGG